MATKKGGSGWGGARPGAGRPPTPPTPTDHTDPLDFLRAVWKGEIEASPAQVRAASAALPFLHKKLGEGGKRDQQADAAEEASSGKFAPRRGPQLVASR